MPERRKRHFAIALALTVVFLVASEIAHHFVRVDDTFSALLLLLGLVAVAYGALGAGYLAGAVCTALLAIYVFHYSGRHEDLLTLSAWPGALIMAILGAAMTWPMGVIHRRELAFRAEIKARAADLERRNTELTELNAALESFGYVVSHDLKEPVRAIENYLAAAEDEWGHSDSRRFVAEAHAANRRLARMLEGLLEYSRASSLPAAPREVRISEIIHSDICRARYERFFEERRVELIVASDIPPVRGDDVLLSQLMGNLLLNAAAHNTNDKPIVKVETTPGEPRRVRITVTDNGPGFPKDVMRRFSRLPHHGVATVKTGFGLVIAQRAARRLNGELWLENSPQGGARAHVELPAA